jgi:hypothetical protein
VFLSTFPQKTLLVNFDLFEYLQDILQQHIFTNCVCRFKRNIAEIGKNERSNQNDTLILGTTNKITTKIQFNSV